MPVVPPDPNSPADVVLGQQALLDPVADHLPVRLEDHPTSARVVLVFGHN